VTPAPVAADRKKYSLHCSARLSIGSGQTSATYNCTSQHQLQRISIQPALQRAFVLLLHEGDSISYVQASIT
jgi:hypothetical protein